MTYNPIVKKYNIHPSNVEQKTMQPLKNHECKEIKGNIITIADLCVPVTHADSPLLKAEKHFYEVEDYVRTQWSRGERVDIDAFEKATKEMVLQRHALDTARKILKSIIVADIVADRCEPPLIEEIGENTNMKKPDFAYFSLKREMLKSAIDLLRQSEVYIEFNLVITTNNGKPLDYNNEFLLEEIKPLFEENFATPVIGSVKTDYLDYPKWKIVRRGIIGKNYEQDYFPILQFELRPIRNPKFV